MIIEKGVTMSSCVKQIIDVLKIIDLLLYESGNHFIIIGTRRISSRYIPAGRSVRGRRPRSPRRPA